MSTALLHILVRVPILLVAGGTVCMLVAAACLSAPITRASTAASLRSLLFGLFGSFAAISGIFIGTTLAFVLRVQMPISSAFMIMTALEFGAISLLTFQIVAQYRRTRDLHRGSN